MKKINEFINNSKINNCDYSQGEKLEDVKKILERVDNTKVYDIDGNIVFILDQNNRYTPTEFYKYLYENIFSLSTIRSMYMPFVSIFSNTENKVADDAADGYVVVVESSTVEITANLSISIIDDT